MSDHYDIFLSYSQRADHDLAEALQSGLERFAKRWNQRRALRVFRDDSVMGLSPALWPQLAASLDRSHWLLVLASPPARDSPWVNQEIEYWLASSPDAGERMLLVLTSGALEWDDARKRFDPKGSSALPTVIPDDLFAEEPKYLDLRWFHEGRQAQANGELIDLRHHRFRDAIATIAAGPHGVDKDELDGEAIRNERRGRRVRRLAVAGLVLLTLTALVLAVVARSAATQAQEALAEAEAQQLLLQSEAASTQMDAIVFARAAARRASDSPDADASLFEAGIFAALTRSDLPLTTYSGLSQPDSSSGGRRGMDVAGDGSAFAFVGTDGRIQVIRAWDLATLASIPLDDLGLGEERGSPFVQLGFGAGAGNLAVVTPDRALILTIDAEPRPITGGGEPSRDGWSIAREFPVDFEKDDPEGDELVLVGSGLPLAAVLTDDVATLAVLDDRMIVTMFDATSGERLDQLGSGRLVPDADRVRLTISADRNRLCAVGGGVLRHIQIDPPMLIADLDTGANPFRDCWAEGCAGRIDNALVRRSHDLESDTGMLSCVDRGGALITDYHNTTPLAVAHLTQTDRDFIRLDGGMTLAALADDTTVTDAVLVSPTGLESLAARVLQHVAGPVLVDRDDNGTIAVWRLERGALKSASFRDEPPPESSPGSSPFSVLAIEDGAVVPVAGFMGELADGEYVFTADSPSRGEVRFEGPAQPLLVDVLPTGSLIVVFPDGTGRVVDIAGSGAEPTSRPIMITSGPAGVTSVASRSGRVAIGGEGYVRVVDVEAGSGAVDVVLDSAVPQGSACQVGLSADADVLGLVVCGSDGPTVASTVDLVSGELILEPIPVRYSHPSAVSVDDDGTTMAVAFVLGQIGVRRADTWIEPEPLTRGRVDHNDFRRGWVELDPTGERMVTRRDREGLRLWSIPSPGDRPLAHLTELDPWPPPDRVLFTDDSLTVAWSSPDFNGFRSITWSTSSDSINQATCNLLTPKLLAADEACPEDGVIGRPRLVEPSPAGPVVAGAASGVVDVTAFELGNDLSPSTVDVASDGTVWTAGTHGLAVIDPGGTISRFPWSNLSAKGVAERGDGSVLVAESLNIVLADRTGFLGQWEVDGFPVDVVVDGDGVGYVATDSNVNPMVHRVVGQQRDDFWDASLPTEADVRDLLFEPSGNLLLLAYNDPEGGHVVARNLVSGAEFPVVDTPPEIGVWNVVSNGSGRLWLLSGDRTRVAEIVDGGLDEVIDLPAGLSAGSIFHSVGLDAVIAVGANAIAVLEPGNPRVWSIAGSSHLTAGAEASDGAIWLADRDGDTLFRLTFD